MKLCIIGLKSTTMKKLIAILLAALPTFCIAQKANTVDANLVHATVYYASGAELEHVAKTTLVTGSQELIINNLSQSVDVKTIQIACPENVTILSYRYNTFLSTSPPGVLDVLVKKMQDSVQQIKKQMLVIENDYNIQYEILQKTTALIEANLTNQHDKTITAVELLKLVDYYNQKILEVKNALFGLAQKKEILNDSATHITGRVAERNLLIAPPPSKLMGQLVLQVVAQAAGSVDFSLSYFTRNAGWLPSYDLRAKSIDNSFKLVYKASVHQSTGIDWKQVKLSLTTANPDQSSQSPVLNPWFVALYVPQVAQSLNEVVVTGFSGRAAGINIGDEETFEPGNNQNRNKESKVLGSLVQAYTSLSESQLNVNFDIDLPYDILSDGKAVSVGIKDESVKADYKHVCIPKLDYDAFLFAQISDWESLNLMPGEANIIMDNVYLGKSFIDPNTTADTLSVSLGRDKRISVTRTLVKEFSKNRIRGDNKVEEYTYELVLKNNKVKAADIILKDHLPVSKVKEVEISVTDKGTAEINEETGILTWNIKLEPGQNKKNRFTYTVRYPKDKQLATL
jgi:uncharacterized protein (TIGR02231 family)